MTLQQVLDRYVRAVSNQMKRRNRQHRQDFTPNEVKAINFYGNAAQAIQTLINQEKTCLQP